MSANDKIHQDQVNPSRHSEAHRRSKGEYLTILAIQVTVYNQSRPLKAGAAFFDMMNSFQVWILKVVLLRH